jgi:hypothetical protein
MAQAALTAVDLTQAAPITMTIQLPRLLPRMPQVTSCHEAEPVTRSVKNTCGCDWLRGQGISSSGKNNILKFDYYYWRCNKPVKVHHTV